jgi:hypothetical protein
MGTIKIVSWNICDLGRLTKESLNQTQQKRRESIIREIKDLTPDILCILEGPKGENDIDLISNDWLKGEWIPVKAVDGEYATQGEQWIWFLVRNEYSDNVSLLPIETWDAFAGGSSWKYHLWGEFEEKSHKHYRHPQVLIFNWKGSRVELIGLHMKSKFINNGEKMWKAGGQQQQNFVREALTARIKMTTEATNVRAYIDAKFRQVENPAVFVMGDLNDGPGKEYFEENYLFFDLISNVQGDVFFAHRYLYHALFDFANDLRWSTHFKDFVDPNRDPHILLDHILFTQGLVDGSLPLRIDAHAGKVEHEIHDLINGPLQESAQTSDHKPVSVIVTTKD